MTINLSIVQQQQSGTAPRSPQPTVDDLPSIDHSSPARFVETVLPYAQRASRDTGLPVAIMVAMAINESGYGKYTGTMPDGSPANNYFGIKANDGWDGPSFLTQTWEDYGNGPVTIYDWFRAYPDPSDSFRDFYQFLQDNSRYRATLAARHDPVAFITALRAAGYATDPAYVSKIIAIARTWDLL